MGIRKQCLSAIRNTFVSLCRRKLLNCDTNIVHMPQSHIPIERVAGLILLVRREKVILDSDLTALYGVETRRLNEQVKRNLNRFPEDFMFQLTQAEFKSLKSQFATSSWGGKRKRPFVFTEHGVLMLSSVLNSDRAVTVNIQIMRTFVRLRQMIASNEELARKIKDHDRQITILFKHVQSLLEAPKQSKRNPIGFKSSK